MSEGYLHVQRVQSRFRKHAPIVQYTVYSLILLAVVFGLFQAVRAIAYDTYKLSVLLGQRTTIDQYHRETLAENTLLKEKIAIYSSTAGIEELARNNLEMVGPDEVLVRLRK